MALGKVIAAVESRLTAQWTRCPVNGINIKGEPPKDGSPYIEVSYPLSSSEQISVGDPGNNLWRETGTFRLVLNVARAKGIASGTAWMDELASLFRGKVLDAEGQIRTFAPTSPAHDDRNESGVYYAMSISIPYEADIYG